MSDVKKIIPARSHFLMRLKTYKAFEMPRLYNCNAIVIEQGPTGHNFPYSFDDVILKGVPKVQDDASLLYRKFGFLNGNAGYFEIGVNTSTSTIFHRSFRGIK